jgi:hypothetical protein
MPRRSRATLDHAKRKDSSRSARAASFEGTFTATFARVVVEHIAASGANRVKSASVIRLNMIMTLTTSLCLS